MTTTDHTTHRRRVSSLLPEHITSMRALLAPWNGKHGGTPKFDKISPTDFQSAVLMGIEMERQELWFITNQKTLPTFENVIEALEDTGRHLNRAYQVFAMYASELADDYVQQIDRALGSALSTASDERYLNEALFDRVKAVWLQRDTLTLTVEQYRLLDDTYASFVRRGAALEPDKKERLKAINLELTDLYTSFSQNQLADEKQLLVLDSEEQLVGLSESQRKKLAAAATKRNLPGKFVVVNSRSPVEDFLASSDDRDLRHKVFTMFTMRGDNNDATDNKENISKILMLRAEKAQILGPFHKTADAKLPEKWSYAHWKLEPNMAKHPDNAMDLMLRVWHAAVARSREEIADMQALADSEGANITIEAWDYRYYAEKVRKARYDVDQNLVKEYLQLDKLRDGMFWAAEQVFGIKMVKLEGVPTSHEDVTVFEGRRGRKRVFTFLFSPYASETKRSGAWMANHRVQERFRGNVTPVISNQCNFTKGEPGEPVLISWDDAITLFHEFGHALHGALSNVTYPSQSGTNVNRDWVELPSQLNESWFPTRELLKKFALHYVTGEPIPDELVEKVEKASTFNMGFDRVEFLASGLFDMMIHLEATPDKKIDVAEFEKATLAKLGCPREIVMRHRPTQFGHIFGDEGYASGYYGYLWADAIKADIHEEFERVGFYHRPTCQRLHDTITSVGDTVAPEDAFFNFYGRGIDFDALIRYLGFAPPKVN